MKTRVIILAGGAGTRLGVLTAKRTKPAVVFGGKYRIIDFTLSNCVNSNLFDVVIIAQYRPQSLIKHIGAGAPWDLDRDFTGGVHIYTPYVAPTADWFVGTADAIQQNFTFIKNKNPDLILILSGDHVYHMDYSKMIRFHQKKKADITIATIKVPYYEASRFGIVGVDDEGWVTSFIEKPDQPPSQLANMGIYLFNMQILDKALWEDHQKENSTHDFGKDILPNLINQNFKIASYPFTGYWKDVGTLDTYWQTHMDLLEPTPQLDLYNRSWIVHTRTEERPPARIHTGSTIEDSLICDGCVLEENTHIFRSILSPGVKVKSGAHINNSIILTDTNIENNSRIYRSILDKRVSVKHNAIVGENAQQNQLITTIGRNSIIPAGTIIQAGATIGQDVVESDFMSSKIASDQFLQTRRQPHEI